MPCDPLAGDLDLPRVRRRVREPVGVDIGDQVAERVRKITSPTNPCSSDDGSKFRSVMNCGSGGPSSSGDRPRTQVGGGRGQDVAAVERGRDDLAADRRVGDLPDPVRPSRRRVTPVIRPLSGSTNHWPRHRDRDQAAIGARPRGRPPRGGPSRRGRRRRCSASTKPPSRMFCGEIVWQTSTIWTPGAMLEQDALDRGHVGAADAEVGRQGDDPGFHRCLPLPPATARLARTRPSRRPRVALRRHGSRAAPRRPP